jgi:hypothetical protein
MVYLKSMPTSANQVQISEEPAIVTSSSISWASAGKYLPFELAVNVRND